MNNFQNISKQINTSKQNRSTKSKQLPTIFEIASFNVIHSVLVCFFVHLCFPVVQNSCPSFQKVSIFVIWQVFCVALPKLFCVLCFFFDANEGFISALQWSNVAITCCLKVFFPFFKLFHAPSA